MRSCHQSRCKQKGQAAVEATLTLAAFLIILLGVLEVGQILFVHQMIGERVRNAVRWAVVNSWDDATSPTLVTNLVLYGTTTPASGAQAFSGLTSQNVAVTRPQPDYSAADRIVVTVSGYALTFLSNTIAQANGGGSAPSTHVNGLTVQQSLPYEVSNGSSH
ncbi:MAG: pilus assembly protein [Acidobacteriota bacterium]|nr:pilus assembly protein [Acidobacteriota bacterium]